MCGGFWKEVARLARGRKAATERKRPLRGIGGGFFVKWTEEMAVIALRVNEGGSFSRIWVWCFFFGEKRKVGRKQNGENLKKDLRFEEGGRKNGLELSIRFSSLRDSARGNSLRRRRKLIGSAGFSPAMPRSQRA